MLSKPAVDGGLVKFAAIDPEHDRSAQEDFPASVVLAFLAGGEGALAGVEAGLAGFELLELFFQAADALVEFRHFGGSPIGGHRRVDGDAGARPKRFQSATGDELTLAAVAGRFFLGRCDADGRALGDVSVARMAAHRPRHAKPCLTTAVIAPKSESQRLRVR